jgi:hypothetical protein
MALAVPETWLAAFPGTRFFPECHLMTWHPRGLLNLMHAQSILHWLRAVEPELGAFNRFVDLTGMHEVRLSDEDVATVAAHRREHYLGDPVTTVFLASTPLSYGIAAIYERLMAGTPIQVHTVVRLTTACRILEVDPDVLIRQL